MSTKRYTREGAAAAIVRDAEIARLGGGSGRARIGATSGTAAYAARQREIAQLERGDSLGEIQLHNARQLVTGLCDGSLDADCLNDGRTVEGMMRAASGHTTAEILRLAGKPSNAGGPVIKGKEIERSFSRCELQLK